MAPLVLTFDPDRYYLQSVAQSAPVPFLGKVEMEKLMSIILSMHIRPKVIESLAAVIMERLEASEEGSPYPPIADLSLQWACHFINSLAPEVPDPEVGAGPSGEVSFDWYDGRDHILTVGIHADGMMNYAYASGNDRAHASRNLEKGLPTSLRGMLETFKVEELEHATE